MLQSPFFSVMSPEFYVACMNSARCFKDFCAPQELVDHDILGDMRKKVADSFFSSLAALKQMTQANVAVATRVIRLYSDCLKSMFTCFKSSTTMLSEKSQRPSVFQCEVWPMLNEQNAIFNTKDVEAVLDIISSKDTFEAFWTNAMTIQDLLFQCDTFSCRLGSLQPLHQIVAHAVTFAADKLIAKTYAIKVHHSTN